MANLTGPHGWGRRRETSSGPSSTSTACEYILADVQELKRILSDPQSHRVIMAAMEPTWWLNEQLQTWLGDIPTKSGSALLEDGLREGPPHRRAERANYLPVVRVRAR